MYTDPLYSLFLLRNKEMVKREATVLAELNHPNIVRYSFSWTKTVNAVESQKDR